MEANRKYRIKEEKFSNGSSTFTPEFMNVDMDEVVKETKFKANEWYDLVKYWRNIDGGYAYGGTRKEAERIIAKDKEKNKKPVEIIYHEVP